MNPKRDGKVRDCFSAGLGVVASLLLAFGGLIGVLKGGGWVAWLGLLFFSTCTFVLTYDLLARLGIVKHRFTGSTLRPHRVNASEEGIVSTHPGGTEERVSWDALETVALRAEDAYPVGDVCWFLIGADDTGCVFPIGAEGCDAVLEAFQSRLPGFDNEALIEAMGLLEGGRVVWRRRDYSPKS